MDVLLIRVKPTLMLNSRLPRTLNNELGVIPPLGLASIAAYLRKNGVETGIIDAEAENLPLEKVAERIRKASPKVVGVTSMTPTVHDDLALAAAAKQAGATVVLGGPQVSAMPVQTMRHQAIDYAVHGEGELPMLELTRAITNKTDVSGIPGLIWRDELGQVRMNPPHLIPDLDAIPFPARDLLPNNRYHSVISKGHLTTVCPGRGCPFKCSFCFKQPSDSNIRFRDPMSIVDEIEDVVGRYKVREINFVADTLTVRRDIITVMCEEIIRRKIKVTWIAPTRADCVSLELLKLMKAAGCRSLRFGVESGSPRIRQMMGKRLSPKHLFNAFKWAKQADIECFAYMIVGYIGETEETFQQSLELVRQLKPNLLMYNAATPLPATPLFDQAVAAGLVDPTYWDRFLSDPNTERIPYLCPETERWIGTAYRQFFFSPRFLLKKMLEFRPSEVPHYYRAVRGLLGLGA